MEGSKPTYCVACGLATSKHHLRGQHGMCNCERQDYVLVVIIETDENILEVYTDGGEA